MAVMQQSCNYHGLQNVSFLGKVLILVFTQHFFSFDIFYSNQSQCVSLPIISVSPDLVPGSVFESFHIYKTQVYIIII